MRKTTLVFTVMVVMTLCSFMPVAQAKSDNDNVTAQDVKKETKELIHALQQYTAEQRDQAIEETAQALKKLDVRIDELETRVDNNWDKMTQAARQKVRGNLKALRQQRNELAEWYGSLKISSGEAWEQMKKGFTGAYQSISDSWEKAKSEFENDTK